MRDIVERLRICAGSADVIPADIVNPQMLRAAADEIVRLRSLTEWRPITEDAKTGDVILLSSKGQVCAGYWGSARRVYGAGSDKMFPWVFLDETNGLNAMMDGASGATHWLPLPPAPEKSP